MAVLAQFIRSVMSDTALGEPISLPSLPTLANWLLNLELACAITGLLACPAPGLFQGLRVMIQKKKVTLNFLGFSHSISR